MSLRKRSRPLGGRSPSSASRTRLYGRSAIRTHAGTSAHRARGPGLRAGRPTPPSELRGFLTGAIAALSVGTVSCGTGESLRPAAEGMRYMPGATFLMGTDTAEVGAILSLTGLDGDRAIQPELPSHEVSVQPTSSGTLSGESRRDPIDRSGNAGEPGPYLRQAMFTYRLRRHGCESRRW